MKSLRPLRATKPTTKLPRHYNRFNCGSGFPFRTLHSEEWIQLVLVEQRFAEVETGMNAEGSLPLSPEPSFVLYCLIRRQQTSGEPERFLLIEKQGHPAFPPTKFRADEDLFTALARVMEGDLNLPPGSYFPERELKPIPNAGASPRYPGLRKRWYLYPVTVSLSEAGWSTLEKRDGYWWTLDEVRARCRELNNQVIAEFLQSQPDAAGPVPAKPSMDALAGRWAASHPEGVRMARGVDIRRILAAGDRAFNLRVADPYLSYQRQGLGFTWSFFTPKDRQDIHVHGLPAVEIYGVQEGRLQLWHKPMNQRGVRVWRPQLLGPGDWAEVEPLTCHLALWLDPEGLGTVIKACAEGELAGVGRLGVSGKTSCQWKGADGKEGHCTNWQQCTYPPPMLELAGEFTKSWQQRDFSRIARVALEAQQTWQG